MLLGRSGCPYGPAWPCAGLSERPGPDDLPRTICAPWRVLWAVRGLWPVCRPCASVGRCAPPVGLCRPLCRSGVCLCLSGAFLRSERVLRPHTGRCLSAVRPGWCPGVIPGVGCPRGLRFMASVGLCGRTLGLPIYGYTPHTKTRFCGLDTKSVLSVLHQFFLVFQWVNRFPSFSFCAFCCPVFGTLAQSFQQRFI